MKGHILGYDGTAGAITGEDGKRYRFTKENWKDERPPAPKDQVDFVPQDEQALEIYRIKPALSVSLPAGSMANGETLQTARDFIAPRPQLVLAVLLLLASLFLNFMEGGGSEGNCCVSLTGVHKIYGDLGSALDQQAAIRADVSRNSANFNPWGFSTSPSTAEQAADARATDRMLQGRTIFSSLEKLSFLLWLVPLGAAAIVVLEAKRRRNRMLEFVVGVLGIVALAFIPMTRFALSKAGDGLVGYAMAQAASVISYGFGAFAIALLGLGLILTALNRIRRVPGA